MKHEVVNVDSHDTLVAAIKDAELRAVSIFGTNGKTLVDMISQDAWDAWDASSEKPNVADCDLLSHDEQFDTFELSAA